MGLSAKLADMGEDEMLDLLATDGMLVKRPILAWEAASSSASAKRTGRPRCREPERGLTSRRAELGSAGRRKGTAKLKIHDLTHLITPDIMVWPGTPKPIIAEGSTLERDGFRETRLELFSHVGTHMDAPAHMLPGAPTLDALPPESFCGTAWALDASAYGPGETIGPEALEAFPGADFLLVSTGWERFWNTPEYFGAYPVLAPQAVERAVSLGVRGIGVDTMGIDPMADAAIRTTSSRSRGPGGHRKPLRPRAAAREAVPLRRAAAQVRKRRRRARARPGLHALSGAKSPRRIAALELIWNL